MMQKIFKTTVLLSLIGLVSCDPFNNIIENTPNKEAITYYKANKILPAQAKNDTLKVASWNIKFGAARIDFFFDCYGDREIMTEAEVLKNMKGIARKIQQMNPDVIFLQEADVDAKRSAFVNQIQWILDNTSLNYAVYASQWRSDFIPSNHIGKMNSGNVILSKYPLDNAQRIPLELIQDQNFIVRYFYLRRNLLEASVHINNKDIHLLATHTSAYATDGTKKKQLKTIFDITQTFQNNNKTFILGGDFNTIPPGSKVYDNFDDDKCAEGSDFASVGFKDQLNDMLPFYKHYQAAISLNDYQTDNRSYFSFTSDKNGFWNRKLDYLFTNGQFVNKTGMIHQDKSKGGMETMPLSDHAPFSVLYILH